MSKKPKQKMSQADALALEAMASKLEFAPGAVFEDDDEMLELDPEKVQLLTLNRPGQAPVQPRKIAPSPKELAAAQKSQKAAPKLAQKSPERVADVSPQRAREIFDSNQPEQNRRGRGRTPAERRESYRHYHENKKKALELEARNHDHLILWPASDIDTNKDQFFNMGGNSAIIYVHDISQQIRRKATLRRDFDNGDDKFVTGICSIKDLDGLRARLANIKVKEMRYRGYEELIFFKLNTEYDDKTIRRMVQEENRRVENLNKLLYSKVLYPDIHHEVLELQTEIMRKVKNLDAVYRQVAGQKAVDAAMDLAITYTQMAHGDMDELAAGQKMLLELDIIENTVSLMNELRLWEVTACTRMGSIAEKARQLIKGKIINKKLAELENAKMNKGEKK